VLSKVCFRIAVPEFGYSAASFTGSESEGFLEVVITVTGFSVMDTVVVTCNPIIGTAGAGEFPYWYCWCW
jgi:hypothetical protein